VTSSTPPAGVFPLFLAYWRRFAGFAGPRLWVAVALLIVIGALEGTGLLMLVPLLHTLGLAQGGGSPGVYRSITSLLQHHDSAFALPLILAVFIAIKAAQAGLRAWSNTLNLRLETDFVCFLRDRFYRAMIQAGWLSLTRQRSSDLTQALLSELPMVGIGTRQMLALLSLGFVALVQVGIALSLSPMMAGMALASGLVVGVGLRRLRRRSYELGRTAQGQRAEMAAVVTEHLAGMKIAKSQGREAHHFEHFRRAMDAIARHTMRLQRINAATSIWLEVGAVLALSLFVYFAVEVRHLGTAPLLVLVFVFTRLLSHATVLQSQWHQVVQALPAFAATEELHDRLAAAAEAPAPAVVRPLVLREGVRFERVSFRYDPAAPAWAVRDLDLVIPARQATALCGPSGAGKSTLADLLLGLLPPAAGRILVDGTPLAGDRLHDWRHSIGYVPQETFLFHETVRANLLWARPDATQDELRAALAAAAAAEFVDRLPRGLDTIVGDRGVRLSGGERQRIALARALLRRPTLLVLDEATSALDTHNERLVQDAIERLHGETTLVLIAHRLSTVRMADRIVVLEAGRIAETGTWDELARREHGVFRRLVAEDTRA